MSCPAARMLMEFSWNSLIPQSSLLSLYNSSHQPVLDPTYAQPHPPRALCRCGELQDAREQGSSHQSLANKALGGLTPLSLWYPSPMPSRWLLSSLYPPSLLSVLFPPPANSSSFLMQSRLAVSVSLAPDIQSS